LNISKQEDSWRNFQSAYILEKKKNNLFIQFIKIITGISILLLLAAALFFLAKFLLFDSKELSEQKNEEVKTPVLLSKNELNTIIDKINLLKTEKNSFDVNTAEKSYKVVTNINSDLQGFLLAKIKRLKTLTRGKPQKIAIVVMEPDSGKIIAMTGFDLADPDANPCLDSTYPAASLIKIVTAAAAIENLKYTPETRLYFNGNKYTLYKRQLKDVKNKYTYTVSFATSFAESINPVFGKIGKNYLGNEKLITAANMFGFNKDVDFEFPLASGSFETNSSKYHLAELGCGFNTDTTISPVFAAMLTSAVINSGNMMLPGIVEHVTDADGRMIYKYNSTKHLAAVNPETAATMIELMQKTISHGTARKSFRGYSRDKILSTLVIGGKTGSLYNKEHTVKYDWFTGFGKQKKSEKTIPHSVVVGHRKYIGTRATSYAKMILKQYFK